MKGRHGAHLGRTEADADPGAAAFHHLFEQLHEQIAELNDVLLNFPYSAHGILFRHGLVPPPVVISLIVKYVNY
jgi:hypothetical protein